VAAFGSRGPVASDFLDGGCQGSVGRGHRRGRGVGWQRPRMGMTALSVARAGLAGAGTVTTTSGMGCAGRANGGQRWG
jgi:hypothetical protein